MVPLKVSGNKTTTSSLIIMSGEGEEAAGMMCRASCGKAEVDDVKLKLVAAISEAWNAERAAELRDNKLFTPPDECYLGECPICFFPSPIDPKKSVLSSCCCKIICMGCVYMGGRWNKGWRKDVHSVESRSPKRKKNITSV
jgi:hypothetical protein